MTFPKSLFSIIAISFLCIQNLYAHEREDSLLQTRQEVDRYLKWHPQLLRTDKEKFKVTPTYGVGYSQETGLMGMGGIKATYRGTPDDRIQFSNFAASLAVSTNLYLLVKVNGTWHSPYADTWLEHLMIRYDASLRYMPERLYGIGFDECDIGNYSEFRNLSFGIRADVFFKFGSFAIGPALGFDSIRLHQFSGRDRDVNHTENYKSFLIGTVLELDTKKESDLQEKGVFVKSENTFRPAFNGGNGFRCTATFDFFIPLWTQATLAADFYADCSSSGAYWVNWGVFGGNQRMRGYYAGRYRDSKIACAQLELRQWLSPMHGIVVWGGAGTLFPSLRSIDFSKILPTYGVGYRLKLLGQIFRIDIGFGTRGQWALCAGINQAF